PRSPCPYTTLFRSEPGRVQDLVGVRVADSGDEALVGDRVLQPFGTAGQQFGQVVTTQRGGVRAERGDAGDVVRVSHQPDRHALLRARFGEVEARAAEVYAQRDRAFARPQRLRRQFV